MKNLIRKFFVLFLICVLTLQLLSCSKEKRPASEIIEEMVVYYGYNGDSAEKTNNKLLEELKETDSVSYKKWNEIMNLWKTIEDTEINIDRLPEGLPDTDELCLVALGFQLNPDGTIKDELRQRLTVVLNCCAQYPEALVVCTGGGTASENNDATEAGMMAEWLIENGLEASRIIVEDKSVTTAQNALYTYEILAEKYPQVKQVAIISSNYHIATGVLFFQSEFILASENGVPQINVVSNAACDCPTGTLSPEFQAGGLIELNGNTEKAFSIYYDEYDIHELPSIEQ